MDHAARMGVRHALAHGDEGVEQASKFERIGPAGHVVVRGRPRTASLSVRPLTKRMV